MLAHPLATPSWCWYANATSAVQILQSQFGLFHHNKAVR